jgi:hypothetical protein
MGKISASLLDKHREINVDHDDWYESILDDFVEDMAEKGIRVDRDKIYFGCGYCQSDDCNFAAVVSDEKKFMEVHGLHERYPAVYHFTKFDASAISIHVSLRHHGGSSTSMSTSIDLDFSPDYDSEDLRDAIDAAMYDQCEDPEENGEQLIACEVDVKEIMAGYAYDLHQKLYSELEYQTSDEAVTDTLECNGIYDEEEDDDTDEDDDAEPADHEPEVQVHAVA